MEVTGIPAIYKHAGFGARPEVFSVKDISAAEFIKAYAAHLKKSGRIELPEWVDYVKTAVGRELPPLDPDWYYVRAASLARKIYLNHGLGVGALARWYGKTATHGNKPQHHAIASRKIIRQILRALEDMGIVETLENGGRAVTKDGQKELDTIARSAALTA